MHNNFGLTLIFFVVHPVKDGKKIAHHLWMGLIGVETSKVFYSINLLQIC